MITKGETNTFPSLGIRYKGIFFFKGKKKEGREVLGATSSCCEEKESDDKNSASQMIEKKKITVNIGLIFQIRNFHKPQLWDRGGNTAEFRRKKTVVKKMKQK